MRNMLNVRRKYSIPSNAACLQESHNQQPFNLHLQLKKSLLPRMKRKWKIKQTKSKKLHV